MMRELKVEDALIYLDQVRDRASGSGRAASAARSATVAIGPGYPARITR